MHSDPFDEQHKIFDVFLRDVFSQDALRDDVNLMKLPAATLLSTAKFPGSALQGLTAVGLMLVYFSVCSAVILSRADERGDIEEQDAHFHGKSMQVVRPSRIFYPELSRAKKMPSVMFLYDSAIRRSIREYVYSCYVPTEGGFCGAPRNSEHSEKGEPLDQQPTLTMTHCALHVLMTLRLFSNARENEAGAVSLSPELICQFVNRCVDGGTGAVASYPGATECDVRAAYSAAVILQLIPCFSTSPDAGETLSIIHVNRVKHWIARCQRFDGGIAGSPEAHEAHVAFTFCAVAALALLTSSQPSGCGNEMQASSPAFAEIDIDALRGWLLRRQCAASGEGGFQGRPGSKPPDSCYTWWGGASLRIISNHLGFDYLSLVNTQGLAQFLRSCRDDDLGGSMAKRPDTESDLMHAYLGLVGLLCVGDPSGQGGFIDPLLQTLCRVSPQK